MSLIDKFLLVLRQLGVNPAAANLTRAGINTLKDFIPGLEGAEHIGRLTDMLVDQVIRVQEEIWKTPIMPKKVLDAVIPEKPLSPTRPDKVIDLAKPEKVLEAARPDSEPINLTKTSKEIIPAPDLIHIHRRSKGNAVTRRLPGIYNPKIVNKSRALRYSK